jgi:DNA-binding GntR family transcriptional regulator
MDNPASYNHSSLREFVANSIRTGIASGELKSGEKISERKIGEMLNVSTTPVKEAFRQLETEGLIVSAPRSGSYVTQNSDENMLELVYLRSAIDGIAALLAARHATEEQLAEMNKVLQKARYCIEDKDTIPEVVECNQTFHSLMRKASNNGYLINIGNFVGQIDYSVRQAGARDIYDFVELEMRQLEHETILKAVSERKPELAERLMVSHIRSGSGKIVQQLGK